MNKWLENYDSYRLMVVSGLAILLVVTGCSEKKVAPQNPGGFSYDLKEDQIYFTNDIESNAEPEKSIFDLTFQDRKGEEVSLRDFQGKKNVVLVVTRGYPKFYCPYCNAQTSRLVRNHSEFEKRNAEVIVVFPGDPTKVGEFTKRVGADSADDLPLSIVTDEKFDAVNQLSIKGDLAKPSTFILDVDGNVRFAYVGKSPSDRPSLKAMFSKLDKINESAL